MSRRGNSTWARWAAGLAAIVVVLGVYACTAHSGMLELLSSSRTETYYNLLVRGFASGHASLARAVPDGLARLPDPFDPSANIRYRLGTNGLHDLSYYHGRLYLYFGPTPALVLFGPAAWVGRFLWHREAAVIFCFAAFLASFGLWRAARRRYFPEAGPVMVAAGALLLGLATGLPLLLARAEVYEVAIACGHLFVILSLAALWQALHQPNRRALWLALASAAYGLALGARPSLLPGAIILAVPLWAARSDKSRPTDGLGWTGLAACAFGPLGAAGLGLLGYNAARFGHFLDFGQVCQLASDRQSTLRHFRAAYLWTNFRVYFLQPMPMQGSFPFLRRMVLGSLPAGHLPLEDPYGILLDAPVCWLALAAPLAWRGRLSEAGPLRDFAAAMALAGGAAALTLCLYLGDCSRYEVEFLPEFGWLAALGLLALNRALARRPARHAVRAAAALLLAWSIAFNLLAAALHHAEAMGDAGTALMNNGRLDEAIATFHRALRIDPNLGALHANLGMAWEAAGRLNQARTEYETALRLDPGLADVDYRLGNLIGNAGDVPGAAERYRAALRARPRFPEAHANLGLALAQMNRANQAIAELEEALRERPDYPDAEAYLGFALAAAGRYGEAVDHYERALARHPDDPDLRYQLERARALRWNASSSTR